MKLFGSSDGGWQCENLPDGTKAWRRFKNSKAGRLATGTQVMIAADPENACEPYIADGLNTLNDEDIDELKTPLAQAKAACMRGVVRRSQWVG